MRPLTLLLTIAAGLLVNAGLTPIIIHFAHRNRWYDEKNHRKIHTEDTPRIGGVGIFIGFLAAIAVVVMIDAVSPDAVLSGLPNKTGVLAYILTPLLGMILIHALGLIDDFRNLRAVVKLLIQVIAAVIVTLGPFRIERITIPFIWYELDFGVFSYFVTVFWIVAISNAINFIDGVDGLAGGISSIAALFFGVIGLMTGNTVVALLAVGLFGSIVGFLIYNAPPARIFMGDSGSYILGFALAVFPLMLAGGGSIGLGLIPAITILAVPILDVTTAVFRRLSRGKHPFTADREHLHHKLMDIGNGTWRILAITYSATLVLGVVALMWYLFPAGLDAVVTLLAWLIAVGLMWLLRQTVRKQNESAE